MPVITESTKHTSFPYLHTTNITYDTGAACHPDNCHARSCLVGSFHSLWTDDHSCRAAAPDATQLHHNDELAEDMPLQNDRLVGLRSRVLEEAEGVTPYRSQGAQEVVVASTMEVRALSLSRSHCECFVEGENMEEVRHLGVDGRFAPWVRS